MQARDPTASWLRVPHPKCNVVLRWRLAKRPLSKPAQPLAGGLLAHLDGSWGRDALRVHVPCALEASVNGA
jgi:hypothetical protein